MPTVTLKYIYGHSLGLFTLIDFLLEVSGYNTVYATYFSCNHNNKIINILKIKIFGKKYIRTLTQGVLKGSTATNI